MITITISSGTTSVTSAVSIATNYVVEGSGAGRQQWRRAEDLKIPVTGGTVSNQIMIGRKWG